MMHQAMTRDEMIKTLESVQTRCIYDSDTDALGDVLAALRAPAVTGEAARHARTLLELSEWMKASHKAACLAGADALAAPPAPVAPPAETPVPEDGCTVQFEDMKPWPAPPADAVEIRCGDQCLDPYGQDDHCRCAPPAVAGEDAPEIQVGDDVTANSFPSR